MSDAADSIHALRQLSLTAGQMKPHGLSYLTGFEPTRDDIRDFQDDLIIIAGLVDRFIEARGNELVAMGVISELDKRVYFTRVVMDAIEGNALYAIESGIEQRIEDRAECA